MKRHCARLTVCVLGAMLMASGTLGRAYAEPQTEQSTRPPNVVLIVADDLGWKDVGFMGSRFYETPNIDRLASEGMRFTSAYANAPNCAPSRAALMSGQYAPRTGVYTVGSSERGEPAWRAVIPTPNDKTLDPGKVTIAEALKRAGYATGHVGKWHLGGPPDEGPEAQGFDVNAGAPNPGKPRSYFRPYGNVDLGDGPEGEYLTDRLTEEAVRFIGAHADRPFFLHVAYHSPHTPIQAPDSLIWKYLPKPHVGGQYDPVYAAMIESLDRGVGQIVEALEAAGLAENTVVMLFSDNGGLGAVTSMAPLRGYKGTLYEGGVRVPMVVRWPGRVAPGTASDTPVMGIDFYPTILDVAGAARPAGHPLDGESLVPLLTGSAPLWREALFWHYPVYLEGGYGMSEVWRTTPVGVVRRGDLKLLEFFEDGRLELYDLRRDIGERNNLAEAMPERASEMRRLLESWRASLNAPFPLERNPAYKPDTLPHGIKRGRREAIYTSGGG